MHLDGQENIILVEFCKKYNCVISGVFKDDELWGESFHNHTGFGLLGALTLREANVSCAALYLWDETYEFTQYSAMIQRSIITHVLPKPNPLPYWQTPMLPFPSFIWLYVVGTFIIAAIILFLANQTQRRINPREESHIDYGFGDSIFAVFSMAIFQGVDISIKYMSNIVYFTILLIFALIIGNLYAGKK